ncbi:MAG TPA: cytosine permease [Streptosporangiaceae bacterium]|nr:cytosine permease [Streptosporangiaceae bacterium]
MSEGGTSSGAATLEQYTIEAIPASERHGRPRDLFTIWFSSNIMPLTFVTGALAPVVFKLPFGYSVLAILVGNLVGALFMALHSAQGPRLGVPQMIQSRGQFGFVGAVLVIAIAVFMYVGFFASNLILGGESINQLAHGISTDWGIVICAVGSLLITVFGYDMIHAVNRWATFLFGGAMLLAVIIIVARGLPADFFSAGSFTWAGFLGAMATTGILWQIAYAPYVSDYSRYMPADESVTSTFWFSYWGVVLGTVIPMIIGVVVGLASANPDQIAALYQLTVGAGWLIMLVFALGIIDTNSINLYGGMLCSITVGQTFKSRWLPGARARAVVSVVIVAVSLIGALAYQSTFLTSYVNFILFLLYVLIPWTAINLVDFYLIRHGNYDVASFFDPSGGIYGRVNWPTLIIYLVGVGVQIPFVNTTLYEGPVAKALNGADISWIVGLAVTIPLYYFVTRARVGREPAAAVAAGGASA